MPGLIIHTPKTANKSGAEFNTELGTVSVVAPDAAVHDPAAACRPRARRARAPQSP